MGIGSIYNLIMLKLLIFFTLTIMSSWAFADLCPSGQYLVSAYSRGSYNRQDGTFVKATNVEAHCRTYNFSSPLKLKFEDQIPQGWPYQLDLFKKWTTIEKRDVKKALDSLPKRLRDLGEIKIYRAVKSSFPNNHASSGPDDSIIVLYDSAKKFGYKQALTHEMSHILFSKLSADEKEMYYSFSDWKQNRGSFYTKRNDFSESDGSLFPEEDFANNVEHVTIKNGSNVNRKISDYLKSLLGLKNEK